MSRTLQVRKPTPREMVWLEQQLEEEVPCEMQRRAQAILYHGLGLNGEAIAHALRVHPNTIYADLKAFEGEGLRCVRALSQGGAPAHITPAQCEAIWHWAQCPPQELGLQAGRWTLQSFHDFLIKRQRVLKQISLEHLRRVLKKKHLFSPRRTEIAQPRSTTACDFSPNSSDVSAPPAQRRAGLF